MLLLVFVSTAVLASVFLSLTVAFACSTSIPPRTMSFTLLAVGAEAPDCIVNFIASRPVSNAAVFRFSQRGFLYAVFRNASSAVEGDEESCGRQGMALNSCVGSQVCVQPLHSPGHADAGDAGAEPASGGRSAVLYLSFGQRPRRLSSGTLQLLLPRSFCLPSDALDQLDSGTLPLAVAVATSTLTFAMVLCVSVSRAPPPFTQRVASLWPVTPLWAATAG
jgi:hypothetical protein